MEQKQVTDKQIMVTQPALPSLDEFYPYLQEIWENKWLTNNGKFHQAFEKELADFLGVRYVSLFANGTLALVTALQVMRITGEVITTPYSFVASTHSLHWNGIKPVFVDVEEKNANINPDKIEAAITPRTTAILPVHVYGKPAGVNRIQEIADVYGLKVIYDACHAFGVRLNGQSILNFGDLSVLSFHATKVFNTMEGGAIVSHDEKIKKRIDYLKNFGFANETTVVAPGINAKMNEMQAALGLLQLKHHSENVEKRRAIANLYDQLLKDTPGIKATANMQPEGLEYNYAYYPVLVDKRSYGMSRDALYEKLKENNIYGRRYFYPLISHFPMYRGLSSADPDNLPVAEKISSEVICLPMYPDLTEDEVIRIAEIINI